MTAEELIPCYSELFTRALWLTKNRQDAEDLVQTVFLKVIRKIHVISGWKANATDDFENERDIYRYLKKIMTRTFFRQSYKSENRTPMVYDFGARLQSIIDEHSCNIIEASSRCCYAKQIKGTPVGARQSGDIGFWFDFYDDNAEELWRGILSSIDDLDHLQNMQTLKKNQLKVRFMRGIGYLLQEIADAEGVDIKIINSRISEGNRRLKGLVEKVKRNERKQISRGRKKFMLREVA